MISILLALAPVFAVIMSGWGARLSGLVPAPAWTGVNRLAYMVLAPLFMFTEILRADLSVSEASFVLAGVGGFLAVGLIAFVLAPIARSGPAFASAHQGAVRWNTFIVLAASLSVLGPQASALVALLMGPAIPVVNIITVWVHARYGADQNASLKGVAASLISNPLIIACLSGLALNLSGLELPPPVMDTLTIIGRGALGVTLMCVGAGLEARAILARPWLMTAAIGMKLLIAPAVFIALGAGLGLSGVHLAALAMCGAAPSPPAAYILTRQMGGDRDFMAAHITASTLLSALAIPAAIFVAGLVG